MKKYVATALLLPLVTQGFYQKALAVDFNPYHCTVESAQVSVVNGAHRYVINGICGFEYSIDVIANYSPRYRDYRERITHSNIGTSTLTGLNCPDSPVLSGSSCTYYSSQDPTGELHGSYERPLARILLSRTQISELRSQLAKTILSQQSRQTAMKVPREIEKDDRTEEALDFDSAVAGTVGAAFSVSSPEDQRTYTVAPLLKLIVPERVDVQYNVNVCPLPMGSGPCDEQWHKFVRAEELICTEQENLCRYEGAIGIPWKADRHYQIIIRPHSRPNYHPIVLGFDFVSARNTSPMKRRLNTSQD